jgi:hypothetical protein
MCVLSIVLQGVLQGVVERMSRGPMQGRGLPRGRWTGAAALWTPVVVPGLGLGVSGAALHE